MNKQTEMATLFQQLQALNPGLDALEAAEKARTNSIQTLMGSCETEKDWSDSTAKTTEDPLCSCNCFEDPNEDYRSLVRKPEYLLKLGPMEIRNPLYLTPEQDKADMSKKIKRAAKNAKSAHKTALKTRCAAEKTRVKFNRLQSAAITARAETRDARQTTRLASQEISLAHESRVRAMEWSACVEREAKKLSASANKVKSRMDDPALRGKHCDHRSQ